MYEQNFNSFVNNQAGPLPEEEVERPGNFIKKNWLLLLILLTGIATFFYLRFHHKEVTLSLGNIKKML